MRTLGESIVDWLEAYGVDTVFGIPGVHTVELYRGLADSKIHHVTPRHEQGAGFMADGYARATGRPGVAFVITGPGVTNILTPMAQAYADSIPMLVVSSVNRRQVHGMGGDLHEIRNQSLIAAQAAAFSHTITDPGQLPGVLARAWAVFTGARPRPVHIQIPLDLLSEPAVVSAPDRQPVNIARPAVRDADAKAVMAQLEAASRPVILCGGGSLGAALQVKAIAHHLSAPVIATTNARGILTADDPLLVPASPSLESVRALIAGSDGVLAIGTEIGRTDYDMNDQGGLTLPDTLFRIDIDAEQAVHGAPGATALIGDAAGVLDEMLANAAAPRDLQPHRAATARAAAWEETGAKYRKFTEFLNGIRDVLPATPIVCDSTQAAYAGNLYYAANGVRQWFNASTGYGALGYGLPAAIGAATGLRKPVICIAGDGGLQFSLTDLGAAVEEKLAVILLVWNNQGYDEIKNFMTARQIKPVGVDLHTPDFVAIGKAYGVEAVPLETLSDLPGLLQAAARRAGPTLIEIDEGLVLG